MIINGLTVIFPVVVVSVLEAELLKSDVCLQKVSNVFNVCKPPTIDTECYVLAAAWNKEL